jgi:hypothetical protein
MEEGGEVQSIGGGSTTLSCKVVAGEAHAWGGVRYGVGHNGLVALGRPKGII